MKKPNPSRKRNVFELQDTLKTTYGDIELRRTLRLAKKQAKLYNEDDLVLRKRTYPMFDETNIYLTSNTVIETARKLAKENPAGTVGILSFASATNPGGGVTYGSKAQEECICRSTPLFEVLQMETFKKGYYDVHREEKNGAYSDRIIYVPHMTVMKSDEPIWDSKRKMARLFSYDPKDRFEVSVISAAAPNLRALKEVPDGVIAGIMHSRIVRILEVAYANGIDNLVLGAFGCGVFQNDPYKVACIFDDCLNEEDSHGEVRKSHFKNVVFSVRANGKYEIENYEGFHQVFKEEDE